MAFNFGNANSAALAGGMSAQSNGAQVHTGPDLEEIQTEELGFLAFSGGRKLKLLPTAWPSESLPSPTSSLLSVASRRGWIAAVGPDVLVLASTDAVRAAFGGQDSGAGDRIPFEPQLRLPLPMRISQLAISADESCLVISAEKGGGLAVHDMNAITQGNMNSAFELTSDGVPLRALLPNPTPEKAEMFAAITTSGGLMVADMKSRQYISGPNGVVLRQQVSCVSWSTKGKQLVAGLGDGTCSQMTPEGEEKARIPRPPQVPEGHHVSSITWLENNVFLVGHTPSQFDSDTAPSSVFHVITRQQPSSFLFQKLPEICLPYGPNRSPPHHFTLRLKDFPPSLQDTLIVSSTASTDVDLVTRSKSPLTNDAPADRVVDVFTTTHIANDSRRAQLSLTEEGNDTSPIGMALDLSSKDKVHRPIMSEDLEQSQTPLPAIVLLNNEGILAAWWVVYADSIRQGVAYPGLVAAGGDKPHQLSAQPTAAPANVGQARPVISNSPFGSPQPLSGPSAAPPAFSSPAFGTFSSSQNAPPSAFGSTSTIGARVSPWGTPSSAITPQTSGPSWGKPAFGSATPLGGTASVGTFGSASVLGPRQSPWTTGAAGGSSNSGPVFGKPTTIGTGGTFSGSGGFGSYANQGGFAAVAASSAPGQSIFSTGAGKMETEGSSAQAKIPDPQGGLFGLGPSGFSLTSSFKGDGTAGNGLPKATGKEPNSMFGTGFGSVLDESHATPTLPSSKDAEMESSTDGDVDGLTSKQPDLTAGQFTAPAPTPAPTTLKLFASTPVQPAVGGTFATQAQSEITLAAVEKSRPTTSFEMLPPAREDKSETSTSNDISGLSGQQLPALTSQSSAAEDLGGKYEKIDKLASTTHESLAFSESTSNSVTEAAPLPPDFLPNRNASHQAASQEDPEEVNLPDGDSNDDDWEDSGEDLKQDRSPRIDLSRSVKFTPQSSFGGSRSSVGGSFTNVPHPQDVVGSRPLFGEIGNRSVPVLPPPSKIQQSPRSPSPVRHPARSDLARPENLRSVSLPGATNKPALMLQGLSRTSQLKDEVRLDDVIAPRQAAAQPALQQDNPAEEEEEEVYLSDGEGEIIRVELASEIHATTKLSPFITHHDYLLTTKKVGVAGQIERLYRDANSMIDTLGLNTRSLKAFIKGHSELCKEKGRDRDDLETIDGWCLVEISELSRLETDIIDKLQDGCIEDVQGKVELCQDMYKDISRLRTKHRELKKIVNARNDPTQLAAARSAPLSAEQATQQHDIRAELVNVQKLTNEAEEGISVLKAKVVSSQSKSKTGIPQAVPTVEAVISTIMKMTTMAEKRSGDVDVLEHQLRKLKIDPLNSTASSRDTALFATPPTSKISRAKTPGSSTYGLFYTPDSYRSTPRSILNSSMGSYSTPTRKLRMAGGVQGSISGTRGAGTISAEDLEELRTKQTKTKELKSKLKNALTRAGPRVMSIDE